MRDVKKNYQGKTRMTIAISIQEDLRNAVKSGSTKSVKQFTSIDDSNNLLIVAQDRKQ